MGQLVIVANRLPAVHERTAAAGGLAVALRDGMARRRKLWFGWSGRTTAEQTRTLPSITRVGRTDFATIDLSERDYAGYYIGFANSTLWPLLHYRSSLTEYS